MDIGHSQHIEIGQNIRPQIAQIEKQTAIAEKLSDKERSIENSIDMGDIYLQDKEVHCQNCGALLDGYECPNCYEERNIDLENQDHLDKGSEKEDKEYDDDRDDHNDKLEEKLVLANLAEKPKKDIKQLLKSEIGRFFHDEKEVEKLNLDSKKLKRFKNLTYNIFDNLSFTSEHILSLFEPGLVTEIKDISKESLIKYLDNYDADIWFLPTLDDVIKIKVILKRNINVSSSADIRKKIEKVCEILEAKNSNNRKDFEAKILSSLNNKKGKEHPFKVYFNNDTLKERELKDIIVADWLFNKFLKDFEEKLYNKLHPFPEALTRTNISDIETFLNLLSNMVDELKKKASKSHTRLLDGKKLSKDRSFLSFIFNTLNDYKSIREEIETSKILLLSYGNRVKEICWNILKILERIDEINRSNPEFSPEKSIAQALKEHYFASKAPILEANSAFDLIKNLAKKMPDQIGKKRLRESLTYELEDLFEKPGIIIKQAGSKTTAEIPYDTNQLKVSDDLPSSIKAEKQKLLDSHREKAEPLKKIVDYLISKMPDIFLLTSSEEIKKAVYKKAIHNLNRNYIKDISRLQDDNNKEIADLIKENSRYNGELLKDLPEETAQDYADKIKGNETRMKNLYNFNQKLANLSEGTLLTTDTLTNFDEEEKMKILKFSEQLSELSQKVIAEETGLPEETVSRIVTGESLMTPGGEILPLQTFTALEKKEFLDENYDEIIKFILDENNKVKEDITDEKIAEEINKNFDFHPVNWITAVDIKKFRECYGYKKKKGAKEGRKRNF